MLVCGTSGGGKSTLATALLERLEQAQYQFCIIDPEGDYAEFEPVVALGTAQQIPQVDAAVRLVQDGRHNAAVNLIGMPLDDRPAQFAALLGRLQELRAGTGRPHWILVDEAHHVLPSSYETNNFTFPAKLRGMVFVTLQPDLLPHAALRMVDTVIAAGGEPRESLQTFAEAVKIDLPPGPSLSLESGEYLVWEVDSGRPPTRVRLLPGQSLRRRHSRKYAEGELEPDRSFYFRGPDGKLSLRAQNLMLFLQLADGVDDETWLYHLGRGDYSQWFREGIKDESLAAEVAEVEGHQRPSPEESRRRIRELVEQRYTLPVPAPKSIVTEEAPTQ